MQNQDYTSTILVDQTPEQAFNAVNNVRGWWREEIEGGSHQLNDEFAVRFGDMHYSRQKLVEVLPNEKVVWLVTDSQLNFLDNKNEWTGTRISFSITRHGDKTQVTFSHEGLVPGIECYGGCSNAWGLFIQHSLYSLITTGKGNLDVLSQK